MVTCRLFPFLSLLVLGCGSGSGEAKPPPVLPAVANDRYERVQIAIDGTPVNESTTIAVDRDFVVTVSFRRLHVWPGMDNPESNIFALVMEKLREHTVTRRRAFLDWHSEKDGVVTFTGKVEALPESGVFGLRIEEAVTTETFGMERYFLFAANVRNVKQ